jgi:regulation of enolase protein 1 (concanavalin A-like superfamily)
MTDITRRDFVGVAAATAATMVVPSLVVAAANAPTAAADAGGPKWLNEPKQWKRDGDSLLVTPDAKTDFWRKTFFPYITDNGHFFHKPVSGDFTTTVKVTGKYHDLYDQAGFMIRWDESNWMKCGVEFVEGTPHMSVVVTRDFSDWSTANLGAFSGPLWLKIDRKGGALDIFHSTNGKDFIEDRVAYLTAAPTVELGLMCAAPEGKGFDVRFDDWTVQPLPTK